MRVSIARLLFGAALLVGLLTHGQAEQPGSTYPSREVQIVVPNEPGGGLDLVARLLAKGLASRLAQPFVVINRSGASGNIGTVSVARAEPNGYTLLLTGVGHLVSPLLHGRAGYEPQADFEPIARIATSPNVMVVNESLKGLSLSQLLEDSRSRTETLSFASAGYGHSSHLAAEVFMARTGVRWLHVPYRGTAPAARALIAGEVALMFVPAGSVQALLATGRVHAVAVANGRRLDMLSAIPTFAELGVSGAEFAQWYGIFTPAGVPASVANVLQNAVTGFVTEPEVNRQLLALGLEPTPMGRAPFTEFLGAESKRLTTLVKQQRVEGAVK